MKLRNGREVTKYGGHGVERILLKMRSDDAVFWSERCNSYVVCHDDRRGYHVVSINGIGEIRWVVEDWNRDEESEAARRYFFETEVN